MLGNLFKHSMHFLLRAWHQHLANPFLQSHIPKLTQVMIVATNWFTTIVLYVCIVLCKFINMFIQPHKNAYEGCSILILHLMKLRTKKVEIYSRSFIKWQSQNATSYLMTSQYSVFSVIQPPPLIDQFTKCIYICCYFISGIEQDKYCLSFTDKETDIERL